MPGIYTYDDSEVRHTEDMQDIITAVPSWLLRWGITLFFAVLLMMISLSAFIKYPDVISAQLQIMSPNSPKPVVSKVAGKLVKLLVTEKQNVTAGQPLAYLESTADHEKVLTLFGKLKDIRLQVISSRPLNVNLFNQDGNLQLGELQAAYQQFFQEYLVYKSSIDNGFLLKKKGFLMKDLLSLNKQQQQLNDQKKIEQRDFSLASDEYDMHKKLSQQKVETQAELRQEESKYLAKKSPLIQTESGIITADNNLAAKQKEILELDNELQEEKGKFLQALNSLLSTIDDWKSKYILSASENGQVAFAGIIQQNQVLTPNQEVFYINPGNEQFFGEMSISQNNMGKVHEGQQVLIKLRSYPFEEYGMIRGKIKSISDVPYKDSVFISQVDFKVRGSSDLKKPIHLKQGMKADAEIITQNATILQRVSRSLFKVINDK